MQGASHNNRERERVRRFAQKTSPLVLMVFHTKFIRVFPTVKEGLLEVFNVILERIFLTDSMKSGVARLLPKVEGIPAAYELHPITLLGTDYKILTKILVKRMSLVLGNCYVGRNNFLDGAVGHLGMLLHAEKSSGKFGLISLDQWKAFDRVFVPFLLQVLEDWFWWKMKRMDRNAS